MVCKHVVESAERFGEDGEKRVGGDRRVREAEFNRVGLDMFGGAVGGAAGKLSGKVEAGH